MRKYFTIVLMIMVASQASLMAQTDSKKEQAKSDAKPEIEFKTDREKYSYAIGLRYAQFLKTMGLEINLDLLRRGIEDSLAGKEPVISRAEQQSLLQAFQKKRQAKAREEMEKKEKEKLGDNVWKTKLTKPEMMTFDKNKDYFWLLDTNKGLIKIKLWPDIAPMHVTSTIYLTKKTFYDGLTFHRIIEGFMAQGGCPYGNGGGTPGYQYDGEYDPNVKHDRPYLLSMANTGRPTTDGSQFFLTFSPQPGLDGKHTIFGEIVEGFDVMTKLEAAAGPKSSGVPTKEKIIINKATIEEAAKK